MWGRGQVSFKIAGGWKRLLARVTDKLWSALTVHAFNMRFQMIFPRNGAVTFWTLNFLRHLTMHSSQVPLKITFIVKKLCTKVTRKLPTYLSTAFNVTDAGQNTAECSRLSTVEFNCSYWPSFTMLHHFCDEIPMTKPQSTPQDLIEGARWTCLYNGSLRILWRKRKVLHHPLSGDVTDGGRSAPVTCMFAYKIKNWHVWVCPFATQSVAGWGTGGVFV